MKTTRQPTSFKVSWFEVPTHKGADGNTVFLPGEECWETFKTRKEAKALFRRLILAMDLRSSYRGKGIVASVYFTECY